MNKRAQVLPILRAARKAWQENKNEAVTNCNALKKGGRHGIHMVGRGGIDSRDAGMGRKGKEKGRQ